jgi:signal transduction histidine kinase
VRVPAQPAPFDRPLNTTVLVFRLALCVVSTLLSLLPPHHVEALPVVVLLASGALASRRWPSVARTWPYVEALLAAAAVPWTGSDTSPLLPYLLAPGVALGIRRHPRELVLFAGAAAGALLLATVARHGGVREEYLAAGVEWVLLALAVGLVACRTRRLLLAPRVENDYIAVRRLLEQLRSLTRHLPTGLDAPSAATSLLGRCCRIVPHDRSAVVVQPTTGAFVPLAVHGAQRVPWRAPLAKDGPLRVAWESGQSVLDRRRNDQRGRRRGSALLAIPLLSSHRPFGLVILESPDLEAFPPELVDQLERLVAEVAPQLETALLFEEVRLEASTEERDRLAREMHDGIAQELAFVGYRLDDLRLRVADDPELAAAATALRGELTTLISDLRLSITDLRTSVRPDHGLGAALSSYLRAVCSGKAVVLELSLEESAFRLPPEQEVALLKAAQAFVQEVRRSPSVHHLTARLVTDPPSADLHLSCDGTPVQVDLEHLAADLGRVGARMTTSQQAAGGTRLDIQLRGPHDDQRASGGRPRTHPARSAPGVRAD